MEASEEPVDQRRTLMPQNVERVAHQVAVHHGNRGAPGALHEVRQSGEMGMLALVQTQGPDGIDQRPRLGQETRVVSDREHPGLAQIRHGEIGCGLACRLEQADRVAVDEIERPYGEIIVGDGRSCRAGEVMPLSVLAHHASVASGSPARVDPVGRWPVG